MQQGAVPGEPINPAILKKHLQNMRYEMVCRKRRSAAKTLAKDEARRIAAHFAKLPVPLDAGALVPTQSPPAVTARHFPPPWTIEDLGACFVVKDASGQKLDFFAVESRPASSS